MEVIRILDLRLYERILGRFRDTAYGNSSKPPAVTTPDGRGGFSVVDPACACPQLGLSDCLCEHIAKFYPDLAPQPCGFVLFDFEEAFPPPPGKDKALFVPSVSSTGDKCHGNVHHVSDDRLKKRLRKPDYQSKTYLCASGKVEPYTHERAVALLEEYFPDPV
jgi:hypothetical protein